MSGLDLRPARATFDPSDEVRILVDTDARLVGEVTVTHLGISVLRVPVELEPGRQAVGFGPLPPGSYAARLTAPAGETGTTAFDVLADPVSRPRYGFVTDFATGREDVAEVTDSLRAFHLNVIQFYDWMYRHADLLPPVDDFTDTLGRELSLRTVRGLVDAVHDAGALAIAYAAVYGAGRAYASAHPEQVLHHRGGAPWVLGDFLWIMDVSRGSAWSRHVVSEMRTALATLGFDGLHLDQYGDPKLAVTATGDVVDLADGFVAVVEAVRQAVPEATLIFNNVNDFPTTATVTAPQDVTYVEVWPPHDEYADLVRLAETCRALAPRRPVVLAAYLEPLTSGGGEAELAGAKLATSTVWASGAQYLLFGERHGVLTHPYYPNYATLDGVGVATLRRFADFAVANGDVLVEGASAPATRSLWGGLNADVVVDGAPVRSEPAAGCVWLRVARRGRRLVVQLVDFQAQADARWNEPKQPTGLCAGVRVRLRVASAEPRLWFGHPAAGPDLRPVPYRDDGEYVEVALPDFDTWGLLIVDC